MHYSVFMLVIVISLPSCVPAGQLSDIYWNSTNPLLRTGDVRLKAKIMDSIQIHCPYYDEATLGELTEQMVIYRISHSDFEHCRTETWQMRAVGRCQNPFQPTEIRHTFRTFSPLPSGIEYQPGERYYFISLPVSSVPFMQRDLFCREYKKLVMRIAIDVVDDNGYMPVNARPSSINQYVPDPPSYFDQLNAVPSYDWWNPKTRSVFNSQPASPSAGLRPITYDFGSDAALLDRRMHDEYKPRVQRMYAVHEVDDVDEGSMRLYGQINSSSKTIPVVSLIIISSLTSVVSCCLSIFR